MLNGYKHVLVPVDGSKEAEAALYKAAAVAQRNKGRVDVLNVINTTNYGYSLGVVDGSVITQIVNDELTYLKDLVNKIKDKTGIEDIHIHARFGSPREVITYEFPRDHQTDLIMMGATGKGRLYRMLEGSATGYVNSHAGCDVIIVRTDMKNTPIK